MNTLYLVQIPQTAGTSLRLAACRHWGSNRIICDHGPGNRHTCPLVEELVYLEKDHHQFKECLVHDEIALLTSTEPLGNLRRIFPVSNIITFVTEPIERLLKEFLHSDLDKSNDKFSESDFLKFCKRAENQNVQSRFLKALPLELYGFIGISERYSESLEIINAEFSCKLTELALSSTDNATQNSTTLKSAPRKSTSGKSKAGSKKSKSTLRKSPAQIYKLTAKTRKIVQELNANDIDLYAKAVDMFDTRLELCRTHAQYIHGCVNHLSEEKITGWAVSTQDHAACKVRVLVNRECVAVTSAQEYLGALKVRNVPRDGYVGFSFRFAKKLRPDDVVSCYVHPTDQLLGGPRKVLKKK